METYNLLHTKLMPPRLPANRIERPALLARLENALMKKLTLVEAPTGFGKTTLVSMWLAEYKVPFAWVALDQSDNDPVRFWTYVITGLHNLDSTVGKSALTALMAPQPESFESILIPLINDLVSLPEAHVLVLEDFHDIKSMEILASISFLLQNLPESLHVIIISRNGPDLPISVFRARGELLEIDATSLRFTNEETGSFLRKALSMDLPSSTISRLQERTEGWAAGLWLMTLSLQNKRDAREVEQAIQNFSGEHRYVADYLIQEVFADQPAATQSFLLKTCFLNRLTGSLCEAVTEAGEGEALLERLEKENLFLLRLESTGRLAWYRYNPLFAESMQALARQRLGEDGIQSIFEKASAWYEQQQLFADAVETALVAKLFERALPLIEKFIEINDLSEFHTLERWMENIPTQEILLHPAICFAYAQVILYSGDRFAPAMVTRIEPLLQAAETAWRARANHQGIGQILSFRGNVALWQGDYQKAFDYAHQSLEELPESDALYRGSSLLIVSHEALKAGRIFVAQDRGLEARALLGAVQNKYGVLATLQVLSEVFFWQGDLEQAGQLNQQIQAEAVGEESMLDDQGIASLGLARIAYEQNDLEAAGQFVAHALDLSKQRCNEQLEVQATICQAYIHAARNDLPLAREVLKSVMVKTKNPALSREIQEVQARLSILAGDLTFLKGWQAFISKDQENILPAQKEREAFTLARFQIAIGKPEAALEALSAWKTDAAESGRLRSQVEAACIEALAGQAASNSAQATQSLIEALTSGFAKGFRRIFLDEGAHMAALLQTALPTLQSRTLKLYATTLLHSFTSEKAGASVSAMVDSLSQQELRVLRLLVEGLSNPDIAQELVLSTNTIKTHVKSIYRKLNIGSRNEAREVARELKLL